MKLNYFVEIRERDTDKVVKRLGPQAEHQAERIERGVNINMNHDAFYTEIVIEEDKSK